MSPTVMFIAALVLLPAVGLVAWAWSTMAKVEAELRSFCSFERMHFEIGPQEAENVGGLRWPTPG